MADARVGTLGRPRRAHTPLPHRLFRLHPSRALLWGCGDPGLHILGQAKVAPAPCGKAQGDVYASAGPVAGAAVRLRCPSRSADIAVTDATGHFEYLTLGTFELTCTVIVEKEGYRSQTFVLRDVCIPNPLGPGYCHTVKLQADLAPAR